MSGAQFTPGPWKVVIDGTLTGAWAEVAQECIDPGTNEAWGRELFRSETTHVRKADCYPPNGTFRGINEAPDEWELAEDGEEHLANARLIAAAPELYASAEETHAWVRRIQDVLTCYLVPDGYDSDEALNRLLEMLDGPEQREIQGRALAAIAKARGND